MGDELLTEFIKNKNKAKKELCSQLSVEDSMPLIGLVIDKELEAEHREAVEKFLEGTGSLDVEIVVVADTDLDSFSFAHVHYVPYSEKSRKQLMQASDMMVTMPFNDLEEMFMNGVIPISHRRNEVADYNPNSESGNGFIYGESGELDHWKVFAALVRALETYKFPYDWKHIINSGLESVQK